MRQLLSVMLIVMLSGLSAVAGDVQLQKSEHTVKITIDDHEFSELRFAPNQPKPYMWPVRSADGTILTRKILENSKEGDHPHHKGIWVAVDEVGGVKFWAEQGKIVNRSVDIIAAKGNPAQLKLVNDWTHPDGHTVVRETTTISVFANRLLKYDIRFFNPNAEAVPFEDTKEGLFGFRMVDSMREKETGHVTNAEGMKGTKECWGRPSAWVDYVGQVEGKTFGVTILDHPLNFRPSRYHVRDYGLFSVSPFGEKAYSNGTRPADEFELLPGGELRLRYGLYIHDGDTAVGQVSAAYQQFLAAGS